MAAFKIGVLLLSLTASAIAQEECLLALQNTILCPNADGTQRFPIRCEGYCENYLECQEGGVTLQSCGTCSYIWWRKRWFNPQSLECECSGHNCGWINETATSTEAPVTAAMNTDPTQPLTSTAGATRPTQPTLRPTVVQSTTSLTVAQSTTSPTAATSPTPAFTVRPPRPTGRPTRPTYPTRPTTQTTPTDPPTTPSTAATSPTPQFTFRPPRPTGRPTRPTYPTRPTSPSTSSSTDLNR